MPRLVLFAHYAAVFRAAWQHRAQLAIPSRTADEAAFLPAALSLQDTPVHPAPRRLAYALMALFAIAIVWSILGKVDIVAIAHGRVIVSERTKLIQPLERSVVQAIRVKDGTQVQVGQALVELDPTGPQADATNLQEQLHAAQAEAWRSQWLLQQLQQPQLLLNTERKSIENKKINSKKLANTLNLTPAPRLDAANQAQLHAEWADIVAKLGKLAAEAARRQAEITTVKETMAKLEATLPLARQREADILRLAGEGFIASHTSQDRTRERIEQERDLITQGAKLHEAQAALAESRHTRDAYLSDTRRTLHERLTQANLRREQVSQEHAKARQREQLTVLRAPVAGTVQQLAVHTTGGVVNEAQVLMVIVPEQAQLLAEVTLENKDIGFVQVGQAAQIKLETFPFTRYGTLNAQVNGVTADAVTDEKKGAIFPATLHIAATHIAIDGKRVALAPGMNLTAEIKTGQRRVIEYLLSPVQRAGHEALRER